MCLFLFSSVIHGLILPALVTHERRISLLNLIFPISPAPIRCYSCASTSELQSALPQWGLNIFCCLDSFLPPALYLQHLLQN